MRPTLLLTFSGRGETAADQAPTYYFTNYSAPEELLLASLENDTGSVVLAAANGVYRAAGDLQLEADSEQVEAFFNTVYHLPLKRLLEEADASDPQYGLTEPRAEILLQDVSQDGVLFRVGAPPRMVRGITPASAEMHGYSSWTASTLSSFCAMWIAFLT